jgi:tetraacyldisaccharide 4'-kinase
MSDRSAPRYRRMRFLFRRVLALPDRILAQSDIDRERFLAAGAPPERVETGGNLKFDIGLTETAPPPDVEKLIRGLQPSAIVLAGSTRDGEEEMVLAAADRLQKRRERLLLVIAPRHPERFETAAKLLAQSRRRFVRRSGLTGDTRLDLPGVLLVDTLGELASLYALADVVFIGGSLIPWGGHNVLEPALAGKPVLVGPHMQNFRSIADTLRAAGGLVQIGGAEELAPAIERLLDDPGQAAAIGKAAQACVMAHRGATRRAAEAAEQLYHRAVPSTPPRTAERLLLWPAARIWERGVRRQRFDVQRLSTFTLSIGNLTAGGTGKTPVLLWLIEQLQARGVTPGVLTRGYRRKAAEELTVLAPGATASRDTTGDEAQMILRRFSVPVGIAADRYKAGRALEERFHPEVFLLDDGFQHRQLGRDLDLVLIDVTEPFGRREFLPLGRLREPLTALGRADAVLLTRCRPGERWEALHEEIRRFNPEAPIVHVHITPEAWVQAEGNSVHPLSELAGRRVLAFCGVGNPAAFAESLAQTGVVVADLAAYADHHRYSAAELRTLLQRAERAGAGALVTTEKDAINLEGLSAPPLPLFWLRTRVDVEGAEELLDKIPCLSKVHQP